MLNTGLKILLPIFLLYNIGLSQRNDFVGTKGEEIVLPDGTPILLRGINLGNWLVSEGYMFKFDSAIFSFISVNSITAA